MWKLFYHGHQPGAEPYELPSGLLVSSWSSEQHGEWVDAPSLGVMGVAYVDDVVGYSRDSGDFYIKPGKAPWAADHWGVLVMLLKRGVIGSDQSLLELSFDDLANAGVKLGESVDSEAWQELKAWMDSDPELPRKSARYAHERP